MGERKPKSIYPPHMLASVPKLLKILDLEQVDRDFYLGHPGGGAGRLFGGLVAAQSVVAAGRTVSEEAPLHSLHAYFLRPGSYKKPIRYMVDRIRDGRTFTTRRVVALQAGEAIFNLSASFAIPEEGISHQEEMPETPGPEGLPELNEIRARLFNQPAPDPIVTGTLEMRVLDDGDGDPDKKLEPKRHIWIRLNGEAPEDPLLRTALLVHSSDRSLISTATRPTGLVPGRDTMGASLDHCVWMHHLPKFDDWILYSSHSPVAHGARALIQGAMYEMNGRLIASVAQEGLIRQKR